MYWIFLGSRPFDFSEGHRVIPGWTMLESRDWWHMRMFDLTYMRKPPGMPWAIAAFSGVLGETEFAARAVSATCATAMSLVAWGFARRWFGSGPWSLAAGLAQGLMPLMWSPGRSAEIEMLNNLGAQLAGLGAVDVLWRWFWARDPHAESLNRNADGRSSRQTPLRGVGTLCIAAGIVVSMLAKGPASVPVLLGIVGGACALARAVRPIFAWRLWAGVFLAAGVIVPLGLAVLHANHDPSAVREDIAGQFLWSRERILGVITLAPLAFLSALPASLGLLFTFGRQARREATIDASMARGYIAALLCSAGWIGSLAAFTLLGVSNARYTMPAAVLLPPVVAYTVLACRRTGDARGTTFGTREKLRHLTLGRTLVWAPAMLAAAVIATLTLVGPGRGDADAGVKAARTFAAALPPGATVWADDVVEARPDVLLYTERMMQRDLAPKWKKAVMAHRELPVPGAYVLLRTDAGSAEGARYQSAVTGGRLVKVAGATVRKYEFTLYRVLE